jgi:hypothetical protein
MIALKNSLNSPHRFSSIKYFFPRTQIKVENIIKKCLGKKINLNNKLDLQQLTFFDLKKISINIKGRFQNNLVKILKPEIKKIIKNTLNQEDLSDFRVSGQIKYKEDKLNKSGPVERYTTLKLHEYATRFDGENVKFATVPHQDLSNNAFRSSSVFIFYFQLTPTFSDTCMMEFGKFKNKFGLMKYNNYKNYSNAIVKRDINKIKWSVPKDLKPKKIFIFNSLSIHRSNKINKTPRIALNVKIQPKTLNYIYKIYNIKKKFRKNDLKGNLQVLKKDLEKILKHNSAFNFELAVINYILGNDVKSKKHLKNFLLFKQSNNHYENILIGSLARKTLEQITKKDRDSFRKKNIKIVKHSCADAILRTASI